MFEFSIVDTDSKGVERITEKGVVAAGVDFRVRCSMSAGLG